ncbi:hypothetical protein GCM10010971_08520 [Silvimonas amylolytica]|uniref:DUF1911 domain-containing protein n=2 Tax=Silvimonas amylolytica TaxID=449663 RepID=A0ABQ2PHD3_9NEIS|nr:hypothetical protein GCM10010971_08520 [Silvimonas amylolytica]
MLYKYSRGDEISELAQYFPPLLDAWEESVLLGKDVFSPEQQNRRRAWKGNLDHYVVCFWLVGLALALEIPDAQWERLLVLVDNEGEDKLLDSIIERRQPGRKIGDTLCHPRPYRRLLKAIEAPHDSQAQLLADFVNNWYAELDRPSRKGNASTSVIYERPYWYKFHDPMGGAYFGFWCIEAVAAVKVVGIDDGQCLGLPNYPGDLLRPGELSTHSQPDAEIPAEAAEQVRSSTSKGWFSRLLGRK